MSNESSLLVRGDPICGNRIREGTEECDCGFEGEESCDILDRCCVGAGKNKDRKGCKFSGITDMLDPNKRCRLEIDL